MVNQIKQTKDKQIVIYCHYSVLDSEWEEIYDLLTGLFSRGKFSNMQVHIEEQSNETKRHYQKG